jgi:polyisoprenoid-binding protein YceI
MKLHKLIWLLLCASCATSPQTEQVAVPLAAPSQLEPWSAVVARYANYAENNARYRLDAAASDVRIYAFRGGKMARLGHNHVVAVPVFDGLLYWPSQWSEARADVRIRLVDLVLDDAAKRAETGGNFVKPLPAAAVASTRANMLGEHNLQAEQYPEMAITLRGVAGDWPLAVVNAEIVLHGVAQQVLVPMRLTTDAAGTVTVQGAFALRQSDFGIKPFTALNGLLAVQDALAIEFVLVAKPY